MRTKPALTSAEVHAIANASLAEAKRLGVNITLAIVDDAGKLLYLERMERAKSMSIEIATKKASTAAISHRSTLVWEERLKNSNALLRLSEIFPLQGGLPVLVDDGKDCVGGVGVSGGSGAEDEQIAAAGIAAVQG
jgi:glc operon protein GlcG